MPRLCPTTGSRRRGGPRASPETLAAITHTLKVKNMETREIRKKGFDLSEEQTCFVVSPIGKEGTEIHEKFRNVLDYVIKPAVEKSDYRIKVLRADDVDRAGSFIKDILELLLNSFIVIADLTDQNPNVFYELGVRHALSARTILIAQDVNYIPSDLREYRTIIYEDSAKGTAIFQDKLSRFFEEIYDKPDRHDNPVMDRLGSVLEIKTSSYEKEIRNLKERLTQKSKEEKKPDEKGIEHITTRIRRIFKILKFDEAYDGTVIFDGKDGNEVSVKLPIAEGKFELYFIMNNERTVFSEYLYIAIENTIASIEHFLADIRVLIEEVQQILEYEEDATIKFIIASNDNLEQLRKDILAKFAKMKNIADLADKQNIKLELWDDNTLREKEKELGIYL